VSAEVTRRLSETPEPDGRGSGSHEEAPPPEEGGTQQANGATSEAVEAMERWREIPGVGPRTAETLVSELGTKMSQFPSAGQCASWAGMTPGQHESAGKKKSSRTRKGSPWLRGALVEAAHAAGRTKETYLGAKYRQLATRRGRKRAAIAVGRLILETAYHLQKHQVRYQEPGERTLNERNRDTMERRLVQKLERLGNKVTVERLAAA
jgi:transposase